ncbi:MAG: hypothetical protein C4527_20460 [Candidatus Omnitrophota bacterium]|jgi:hypothetical protein|nr:MAG: hypothetical protein C4527_20460 [Candidatus Omnitrophota bacterium]
MTDREKKDLLVLVADSEMEYAVSGLLSRRQSLGIRTITFEIKRHLLRDSGCFRNAPEELRSSLKLFRHALVLFDRDGCGKEIWTREQLETDVEERLYHTGWKNHAAAVAIDPELEIWIWSDSPHVDEICGWRFQQQNLRNWLYEEGFIKSGEVKPKNPKKAFQTALRRSQTQFSSHLFHQLAQKVSLERCTDPAFLKFKKTLQIWFSSER